MRIAVTIQHPAHVHFFRPVVAARREAGDHVALFVREKDVATALLTGYGLGHQVVGTTGVPDGRAAALVDRLRRRLLAGVDRGVADALDRVPGPPESVTAAAGDVRSAGGMAAGQLRWEAGLYRRIGQFDPDVITAIGGVGAAHVGRALGVPSVVFTDSEVSTNRLMTPFASVVATPRSFDGGDFGRKHRRYDGFHELAYLHPDRFTPDGAVLRKRGVDPDEPYVVARFGAMAALHDRGERGLTPAGKRRLLSMADSFGTVYVAAERGPAGSDDSAASGGGRDADRRDANRRDADAPAVEAASNGDTAVEAASNGDPTVRPLPVAPHELHHLLAHADLVVADAATTAVEAGILGTPSVRVTSLAAPGAEMGTLRALHSMGIVRSTADEAVAERWVGSILDDPAGAADRWALRRERLLDETIDVADYATRLVATVGRSQSLPEPPSGRRRRTTQLAPAVEASAGTGGRSP